MGGTVSAGGNNSELVDNLVEANYITKTEVERVFRAVDRGHYFPDDVEVVDLPYRDVAWRGGNLHISAPCIYSEVMENLDLQPGLSFMNLGSGTGYLSTMAGLMLGANGRNHGVEMFEDVVAFAEKKLRLFQVRGASLDQFEFCPPQFVCGNALLVPSGTQYDRVYCGAACNDESLLDYLKSLVKVGGILISPVQCELVLYRRVSETEWTSKVLLPVAFAVLLGTMEPYQRVPILPESNPFALEDLCRLTVRAILRKNIFTDHPQFLEQDLSIARSRLRNKRKARCDDSDPDDDIDDKSGVACVTYISASPRVKQDSGIVEDLEYSDMDSVDWECAAEGSDSGSDPSKALLPEAPSFPLVMRQRIKALGLPKPLLQYLNMGKPL